MCWNNTSCGCFRLVAIIATLKLIAEPIGCCLSIAHCTLTLDIVYWILHLDRCILSIECCPPRTQLLENPRRTHECRPLAIGRRITESEEFASTYISRRYNCKRNLLKEPQTDALSEDKEGFTMLIAILDGTVKYDDRIEQPRISKK